MVVSYSYLYSSVQLGGYSSTLAKCVVQQVQRLAHNQQVSMGCYYGADLSKVLTPQSLLHADADSFSR